MSHISHKSTTPQEDKRVHYPHLLAPPSLRTSNLPSYRPSRFLNPVLWTFVTLGRKEREQQMREYMWKTELPCNPTRTLTPDSVTDYEYDYDNRLVEVSLPTNSDSVEYTYDAMGRRLTKKFTNHVTEPLSLPTSSNSEASDSLSFPSSSNSEASDSLSFPSSSNGEASDSLSFPPSSKGGRGVQNPRSAKDTTLSPSTTNTDVTTYKYHYIGGQITEIEIDAIRNPGEGQSVLRNEEVKIHLGANSQPISYEWVKHVGESTTSATYYYHYDIHGNVLKVTDSSENVKITYTYDVLGKILTETNPDSILNFFTFRGASQTIWDSEVGMYYSGGYYRPDTGTALQGTGAPVLTNPASGAMLKTIAKNNNAYLQHTSHSIIPATTAGSSSGGSPGGFHPPPGPSDGLSQACVQGSNNGISLNNSSASVSNPSNFTSTMSIGCRNNQTIMSIGNGGSSLIEPCDPKRERGKDPRDRDGDVTDPPPDPPPPEQGPGGGEVNPPKDPPKAEVVICEGAICGVVTQEAVGEVFDVVYVESSSQDSNSDESGDCGMEIMGEKIGVRPGPDPVPDPAGGGGGGPGGVPDPITTPEMADSSWIISEKMADGIKDVYHNGISTDVVSEILSEDLIHNLQNWLVQEQPGKKSLARRLYEKFGGTGDWRDWVLGELTVYLGGVLITATGIVAGLIGVDGESGQYSLGWVNGKRVTSGDLILQIAKLAIEYDLKFGKNAHKKGGGRAFREWVTKRLQEQGYIKKKNPIGPRRPPGNGGGNRGPGPDPTPAP